MIFNSTNVYVITVHNMIQVVSKYQRPSVLINIGCVTKSEFYSPVLLINAAHRSVTDRNPLGSDDA